MFQREATVAVLLRADRFLAIRHGPAVPRPGHWQPLSGKIEPGQVGEPRWVTPEEFLEVSYSEPSSSNVDSYRSDITSASSGS